MNRRTFLSAAAILAAAGVSIDLLAESPAASANAAWGGYSNGQIPLSALDVVTYPGVIPYQYSSAALPYVYLVSGCSQRLLQMLQQYHNAFGGYLRVAEGYRTLAGQQYWFNQGTGGPVGQSNHGWGEAVDFDKQLFTSQQAAWLASVGPSYYFFPLNGDYGHYNYTGPITPPPTMTSNGKSNMLLIYIPGTTYQFALFGPNFWYEWTASSGGDPMANSFAAQITGGATIGGTVVTSTQWAAIKAATGH